MLKSEQPRKKILFKMTGSIAAFKACALISKLVQLGHEVRVAASKSALQFIGPATLEGLTGQPVVSDLWEQGKAMDHIHLVRWADLMIVAPASANFINRVAQGIGDDLLTTMFLAHDFKKPYLIAPAMNTSMYLHPATQRSLQTLKSWGIQILESASGVLACGEVGHGRLLEPEALLVEIERALADGVTKTAPHRGTISPLKVLVTLGGTVVPVDEVRALTNTSTGATGAAIAERLSQLGFAVTCLASETAVLANHIGKVVRFKTFADLRQSLQQELNENTFSAIVHAAAVSDYEISEVLQEGHKLTAEERSKISSGKELTLILKPNEKLVDRLREWSKNKNVEIVAFKLTANASSSAQNSAAEKLFEHSGANYVVINDSQNIGPGRHVFSILDRDLVVISHGETREDLAAKVSELFVKDSISLHSHQEVL